jgi:hypothetical protein
VLSAVPSSPTHLPTIPCVRSLPYVSVFLCLADSRRSIASACRKKRQTISLQIESAPVLQPEANSRT